mgnify:CR=1 FL=1
MRTLAEEDPNDPTTSCKPFSLNRTGLVLGEGAAVLILEEMEMAKARGAKIYAEVVGYGATSDGYDMVAPSGEGAERCMRLAMQGVDKVDYINTHGTSTPAGDIPELLAIERAFGSEKVPPLSSTKSMTGHSLGAAGVHEAIYSILMLF